MRSMLSRWRSIVVHSLLPRPRRPRRPRRLRRSVRRRHSRSRRNVLRQSPNPLGADVGRLALERDLLLPPKPDLKTRSPLVGREYLAHLPKRIPPLRHRKQCLHPNIHHPSQPSVSGGRGWDKRYGTKYENEENEEGEGKTRKGGIETYVVGSTVGYVAWLGGKHVQVARARFYRPPPLRPRREQARRIQPHHPSQGIRAPRLGRHSGVKCQRSATAEQCTVALA